MGWLLGMDTATQRGNLALAWVGDTRTSLQNIHLRSYEGASLHAEQILGEAEQLLQQVGISPFELQTIAVGVGPGSFSGVRVGVVTAKALALCSEAQVIPIGSLEAMAWAFRGPPGPRIAILDARRDELFAAAYDETGTSLLAPTHLTRTHLPDWLAPLLGGVILGEVMPPPLPGFSWERSPETDLPGALAFLELALTRSPVPVDSLEPTYLRPPDAVLMTNPPSTS